MGDALLYGGIIFGGLTVVIIIVGAIMSRRKTATVSKEYGGALPTSAAMDEALEGTAGSSATGGIDSNSLWDDEVKPLEMDQQEEDAGFEDESMDQPSSAEEMFSGDESIESIASMGTEPEPVAEEAAPAPVQEAPAEAPPLPASGLPEGWTMDQWKWYGHEYLAKYGNE